MNSVRFLNISNLVFRNLNHSTHYTGDWWRNISKSLSPSLTAYQNSGYGKTKTDEFAFGSMSY